MSFFSYKNANADLCPGTVSGNVLTGLNKRVCIQVKNVFDVGRYYILYSSDITGKISMSRYESGLSPVGVFCVLW